MMRKKRVCAGVCAVLGILLFCVGCTAPMLPPPSAEKLLSYETKPFLCTFSVTEPDGYAAEAILARTADGDTLTVTGEYGARTVFRFTGGETFLTCTGSDTEEALSVPVLLPDGRGAGLWRSMFSLAVTAEGDVSRTEDGIVLRTGTDTLLFSEDGVPRRIVRTGAEGDTAVRIVSFVLS